ncbi:MAG: protein rep, partial [Bacteroidales bacterium]|nr:protein rep [Bacteroidales bacterium]
NVKLLHNKKYMRAHYGNLMVCGSVWTCPVCASKISERRKAELIQGFNNWPGGLVLVTLTIRHNKKDKLAESLAVIDRAYKLLTHGRGWQDIKTLFGISGSVSNLEITYSDNNGWHPHKHIVYLVDNNINVDLFDAVLSARWLKYLKASGGYGLEGVALTCVAVTSQKNRVAEYISAHEKEPKKELWTIESELTKAYYKSSSSFWSFLDDWIMDVTTFKEKQKLIKEYAACTKGRRSVVFSRGLRDLLNIGQDKNDLEISQEQEENSELLLTLAREIWQEVVKKNKRGELLKVASNGSLEDVIVFLDNICL